MEADVDVSDIENEAGVLSVFAPHDEYFKAKQAIIEACGEVDFDVDEIQFIPQVTSTVNGDDVALFEKFLAMLDDLDDVQQVYHNIDLA